MSLSDLEGLYVPTIAVLAVAAGVIAGLLFAFSNFVMQSLDDLEPSAAILAMQSINRRIVNPIFLLFFGGAALTSLGVVGYLFVCDDRGPRELWAAGAGALYLVGVIGTTALRNIPMNNRLDAASASAGNAAETWSGYRGPWVRANTVRTLAAVASAAAAVIALTQG